MHAQGVLFAQSYGSCRQRGESRPFAEKRKNGKESYEYLFDNDNELICVYFYGNHNIIPSVELFVRNNDVVQSFYFVRIPGHKGLRFITEVIKENGKIIEYRWAMFNVYNGNNVCDEIKVEKYDYKDDRIQSFHYYEYYPRPKRPMLNHDKFTLFWDENGKIQSVKTEYLY